MQETRFLWQRACGLDLSHDWRSWETSLPAPICEVLVEARLDIGGSVVIGAVAEMPTIAPPASLLQVVGGNIQSSTVGLLTFIRNPLGSFTVGVADAPDLIQITFNDVPDSGTVSASSFSVLGSTGPLSGSTTFVSPVTCQLALSSALPIGSYVVRLNGSTAPSITKASLPLDGEPLGLPSGDQIPGGDFLFSLLVISGSSPPLSGPPPLLSPSSFWTPAGMWIESSPVVLTLKADDMLQVARAEQWNFGHQSSNLAPSTPQSLRNVIYLKSGSHWINRIPIYSVEEYGEIELTILENLGTDGLPRGLIPVVSFYGGSIKGSVGLLISSSVVGPMTFAVTGVDVNAVRRIFTFTAVFV